MLTHTADVFTRSRPGSPMSRRTFLQTIGTALATGFTAIADDLVWLVRFCCFGGCPRFAGAG